MLSIFLGVSLFMSYLVRLCVNSYEKQHLVHEEVTCNRSKCVIFCFLHKRV